MKQSPLLSPHRPSRASTAAPPASNRPATVIGNARDDASIFEHLVVAAKLRQPPQTSNVNASKVNY
jgi:hypothetical protein